MLLPRKISPLNVCAILASVASIALFFAHTPADRQEEPNNVVDRAPAEPGALPAAVARLLAAGPSHVPQTRSLPLPASSPAPISTSILSVLPGLDHAVNDWRAFRPDKIVIAPFPDLPIAFDVTSVKEQHGRTVWTGRNGPEGAFLVSSATEHEWHAVLAVSEGGVFEITITGETATVIEKTDDGLCGLPLIAPRHTPVRAAYMALGDTAASDDAPPAGAIAAADVNVVDILFFYDAATLAAAASPSAFETRMIANVEASNLVIQNTQVANLQWRYTASYQIPAYTQTEKMEDDLDQITYTRNPPGQFVREKSILHGADTAVLYVAGQRDFAGIAWMPGRHAVVIWNSSFMTLAHEVGHNAGCNHDRATAEAVDGDGKYNYGYKFINAGRETGTVMSYASSRVQYFSNPDVIYQGQPLGVPENQPKAANNARVLRESAASMAGFRAPTAAPTITMHPQATSVAEGQSFTLSVTASGSTLSYQWMKGTATIVGAASSTYTKSGSIPADAGSYHVVVSNPAGSVASNAAAVTITAPPPAVPAVPPAAAAPAASGGGGGSTGGWFTAAFALLLLTRRVHRQSLCS